APAAALNPRKLRRERAVIGRTSAIQVAWFQRFKVFTLFGDPLYEICLEIYFFNILTATSLKNTISLSLWFCRPMYPSFGRGPRWGSKLNLRSGTGSPSV